MRRTFPAFLRWRIRSTQTCSSAAVASTPNRSARLCHVAIPKASSGRRPKRASTTSSMGSQERRSTSIWTTVVGPSRNALKVMQAVSIWRSGFMNVNDSSTVRHRRRERMLEGAKTTLGRGGDHAELVIMPSSRRPKAGPPALSDLRQSAGV